MTKSVGFTLAAFLLCIVWATNAQAQQITRNDGGVYLSVRGGLAQMRHDAGVWNWGGFDPVYDPGPPQVLLVPGLQDHSEYRDLEMDLGYVVGAAVGYKLVYPGYPGALRFEMEAIYRSYEDGEVNSEWFAITNRDDSNSLGHVDVPYVGSLEVSSAMANVLMEMNTGSRFSPYFGLGGGISHFVATGFTTDPNHDAHGDFSPQIIADDIYALSWQAIVGVGYNLSPGTMLTLEVRHFRLAADRWSDLLTREELEDAKFDDWSLGLRFTF